MYSPGDYSENEAILRMRKRFSRAEKKVAKKGQWKARKEMRSLRKRFSDRAWPAVENPAALPSTFHTKAPKTLGGQRRIRGRGVKGRPTGREQLYTLRVAERIEAIKFSRALCTQLANTDPVLTHNPPGALQTHSAATGLPAPHRPTLSVLCNWIADLWVSLNQYGGAGLPVGSVGGGGLGAPKSVGTYPMPDPVARYPFEGPSPTEWSLYRGVPPHTYPEDAVPGCQSPDLYPTDCISQDQFATQVQNGVAPWLYINSPGTKKRFFVLFNPEPQLGPTGNLLDYGFNAMEATMLGLAFRVLQQSLDQLPQWWQEAQATGGAPAGLAGFDVFHDGVSVVDRLAGNVVGSSAYPNVVKREGLQATGGTFALIQSPHFTQGGAANMFNTGLIQYALHRVSGWSPSGRRWRTNRLRDLRQQVVEYWHKVKVAGWGASPATVAPPPGFADAFQKAAHEVASAAGLMAHEMFHLTWAQQFDRPQGSLGSWQDPDDGSLLTPQIWRPYHFPGWQETRYSTNPGHDGRHVTPHNTTLLMGMYLQSLLIRVPMSHWPQHHHDHICAVGATKLLPDGSRYFDPYYSRFCVAQEPPQGRAGERGVGSSLRPPGEPLAPPRRPL